MTDRPSYWFPAKRYGWGWGLPRVWQGWAVMVVFGMLVLAGCSMGGLPSNSADLGGSSMATETTKVEWLEPWSAVIDDKMRATLEAELIAEVAQGHTLFQRPARAIARRDDQDDVLYAVGTPSELAVVHLSYAARPDRPPLPTTAIFESMAAFIQDRMKLDHDEFAGQ
jgi:hypothetical protein